MIENNTVLITGGFGYIGGRIAAMLNDESDLALLIGTRQIKNNEERCKGKCRIVYMDLLNEDNLNKVCKGVKQIIHLAALNEIDSAADTERALLVNGLGTFKLLKAAEGAGVERFIYFSTIHVYGSPLTGEITEKTSPRPVHPYAITHRIAEDFVLSAHARGKITGIVVRLSNSIGAPAYRDVNRWTLAANDLCRQSVVSRKLVLKTSGLQLRDFIAMSDVGRAVIHLMRLSADRCGDGLFNLGGEHSMSILDLAKRIANRSQAVLGYLPPIERPETAEKTHPFTYRIDKLKETMFVLKGDMTKEIDETLNFCRNHFSGEHIEA
ncbi:3-beta hydroxysteroid dehydrogenase/isomerase family protein [Candidatus Magnetoovum chiemensis]|nr:3-beta hydroxysteroid dehydrogenase/isomerase family protein [Candidatus Magnetoovum chiemensis]